MEGLLSQDLGEAGPCPQSGVYSTDGAADRSMRTLALGGLRSGARSNGTQRGARPLKLLCGAARADQSLQSRRARPDEFCISQLASLLLSQGQEAIDLNPQLTFWPCSEEQSLWGAIGGGGRRPCEQTEPRGGHCLCSCWWLVWVTWPGQGKGSSRAAPGCRAGV